MLISALKRAGGAFLATVGVLVVCGLALGQVEGLAHSYLYAAFGWGGIVATGMVGTPIHELGHFLFCKLFGFHVGEVALFRPLAGRADGILGYVQYSYNPENLLQLLGCFFVGVAPLILGALVIVLVLRLLAPEVFRGSADRLSSAMAEGGSPALLPLKLLWAAISGFFGGLVRLRGWGLLRGVICLYLVFSISTHMTLSPADLQSALPGLAIVALICLAFGLVTALAKIEVRPALAKTAAFLAAYLGIGVFFALLTLVLSRLLYGVLR